MTDIYFAADQGPRAKRVGKAIRSALAGKGPLRLAIAYVSGDLRELLGIDLGRRKLTLLCDAWSGACDPFVLRDLAERPNVKLFDVTGLHAKVMVADDAVVVGSANASGQALQSGKIEAVSVIRDTKVHADAVVWFDALAQRGTPLKHVLRRASDFQRLRALWRRQQRPATRKPTVLEALEGGDLAVEDFVFIGYTWGGSTSAKQLRAKAKERGEVLPPSDIWERYEDPYDARLVRVHRRLFEEERKKLLSFWIRTSGERITTFVHLDDFSADYVAGFRLNAVFCSNFLRVSRCAFDLRGADAKDLCRRLTAAVRANPAKGRALYQRSMCLWTADDLRRLLASAP